MKIKPTAAGLCLFSAAALTLVSVILRTVAMFTCYDTEIGYFDPSLLSTLLTVLSFVAVLLPAALCIATPAGSLPSVWPEPRRNFAPVLPFALFASAGVWLFLLKASTQAGHTLQLPVAILGVIAALYYLLALTKVPVAALAAVGYAPVLWALFAVAETYTDQFTTMNSPVKLILQFGFLGTMLMTTSELRFRLGKSAPRAALCFHCIALFFCLNGSIPTLISLAAGILDRSIHGAYALALLGVGVYAAFRLIFYFTIPAPEAIAAETDREAITETEPHDTDPHINHTTGE